MGSTGDSTNKGCRHEAPWADILVLAPGGLQVPDPAVLGTAEPSALHQSQMSGEGNTSWPCDQDQQYSDHSLVHITALGPWSWSYREHQDPLVNVISLFP